jgi:predicted RNA-binding Zn-ribbon protein involved in translation (DUF1610 family)
MAERAHTNTSQQIGDPLPASLQHALSCAQCGSSIWRVATLDDTSIVYHCVSCGTSVRLSYDAATMTWTAVAE